MSSRSAILRKITWPVGRKPTKFWKSNIEILQKFTEERIREERTSEKQHVFWIGNLHSIEQQHTFYTEHAPVHVVPQEQVPVHTRRSPNGEKLKQVIVLAMDITHDQDGNWHLHQCWLILQKWLW